MGIGFPIGIVRGRGVGEPSVQPQLMDIHMAVKDIKAFADKARADSELQAKLKACEKIKELRQLAKEVGFDIIEDELYPPNEVQFTEDQLSERLVKAFFRV